MKYPVTNPKSWRPDTPLINGGYLRTRLEGFDAQITQIDAQIKALKSGERNEQVNQEIELLYQHRIVAAANADIEEGRIAKPLPLDFDARFESANEDIATANKEIGRIRLSQMGYADQYELVLQASKDITAAKQAGVEIPKSIWQPNANYPQDTLVRTILDEGGKEKTETFVLTGKDTRAFYLHLFNVKHDLHNPLTQKEPLKFEKESVSEEPRRRVSVSSAISFMSGCFRTPGN